METITSKTNSKIEHAKKLLNKKYRKQSKTFLIETEKVVRQALFDGMKPICFFVDEEKHFDFLQNVDCPIFKVSSVVFKTISSLATPDGIVGEFEKRDSKKEYFGGDFLILDNLQNPDNFGALLRTAVATGFDKIYVINCADEYSTKVTRASMGNQFKIDIVHIDYDDIPILFAGTKIFVASMEGKNIFEIPNFEKNVGLIIGNEGNGVSSTARKYASDILSIPMENGVESLNASVSASVIMYYIYSKSKKFQKVL